MLSLLCVQVPCSVYQVGMSQVSSCCAILLSLMAVVAVCEGELMARMSGVLHYHLNKAVNIDLNTNQRNTCLSGCLKTTTVGCLRLFSLVPAPVQRVLDEGWKKWVQPWCQLDADPKCCGEGRWSMCLFSASGDTAQPSLYLILWTCV